jgi:hypothetical protein
MNSIMIMQYLRAVGSDDSELDPEKYCERGLESYQSKEKKHEIEMKRKVHQFLVIQEQARQASLGTKDPERLRLMAASQSEGSLRKAQLRAALDQHENNSNRPLTEQEKLQVALVQHQRIVMCEKAQEAAQAVAASAAATKEGDDEMETDEPEHDDTTYIQNTGGIMTLASLWAQEDATISQHKNGTHDGLGRETIPFNHNGTESSSNATFASQQAANGIALYLSKTKAQGRNNRNIVSQAYWQPGFCDPNMPLVAFGSTSSASTAIAQNALKSTCNQSLLPNQSFVNGNNDMPYPMITTMSDESLRSSTNDNASNYVRPQNHNSNVVPTSTLAAMQITDQHQHPQQYASIFGRSPR